MARVRLQQSEDKTNYFRKKERSLEFISSGCTLLDLVLGGGWPLRRVSNIVGDKSTGKTALAIEAMINFLLKYPEGIIQYQESESAFDAKYASGLGPEGWIDNIEIIEDVETVAETFKVRNAFLKKIEKRGVPGLYIIDSLDGIHDSSGDEAAEGYDKAKRAGAIDDFITKSVGKFKRANANMFVISQIRDNIGAMFGSKYRRAGGKALDFYAAQCLWLTELKKIVKTVDKEKRPVAIRVGALAKKNKVGNPYRGCEFPLIFGYGVDDATANIEWLKSHDYLDELNISLDSKVVISRIQDGDNRLREVVISLVQKKWFQLEKKFMMKTNKYE